MDGFLTSWAESAKTAAGFFWKSGWAFILGYAVSAGIQAFVPKARLTRHMGDPGAKSIALSTLFGSISSSCSFAALATARSLVVKGAHFVAGVAFMFASTNLVIELGILIVIFLGWKFLAAEIVGGLVLVTISSILIRLTYPKNWMDAAREIAEKGAPEEEEDFDWRRRVKSGMGWRMVGHRFVGEWQMVWEEIAIGFTVAGFVAVLVPAWFWEKLFLVGVDSIPGWAVALENAAVAPFVAATTFIGSMGNIPLATILHGSGVMFAGIMGFIYSDLMVPPLVAVNAKYYGWRVALYIAGVMFVSIIAAALILHGGFAVLGLLPEGSGRDAGGMTQFAIDYTFWLNLGFGLVAGAMTVLHRLHMKKDMEGEGMDHGGWGIKRILALVAMAIVAIGGVLYIIGYR